MVRLERPPTTTAMRLKALSIFLISILLVSPVSAMGLHVEPAQKDCNSPGSIALKAMPDMALRLAGSHIARGTQDIQAAWLTSPTMRYPHRSLGSATHAGSVTVQVTSGKTVVYELPISRVFEDLSPRLVDLDNDGKDELVLIESEALRGASVVVLGLHDGKLVELARSPPAGSTFRWLNIVGAADFDGNGKMDIAAITTPHIGGTLKLYHYRPPQLVAYASAMDVSNHLMGSTEQQMAVIVQLPQTRPTIIVPDMSLKALHALRWQANGQWMELSDVMPLPAKVDRLTPIKSGACALLADQSWWRVMLMQ
jgi:FG-GAP-like repeat